MCGAYEDLKHLAQEEREALEKNASMRVGFSESTSLELVATGQSARTKTVESQKIQTFTHIQDSLDTVPWEIVI